MGEREVQQEYIHSSKLELIQKEYAATMVYEMLNIDNDATLATSAHNRDFLVHKCKNLDTELQSRLVLKRLKEFRIKIIDRLQSIYLKEIIMYPL